MFVGFLIILDVLICWVLCWLVKWRVCLLLGRLVGRLVGWSGVCKVDNLLVFAMRSICGVVG